MVFLLFHQHQAITNLKSYGAGSTRTAHQGEGERRAGAKLTELGGAECDQGDDESHSSWSSTQITGNRHFGRERPPIEKERTDRMPRGARGARASGPSAKPGQSMGGTRLVPVTGWLERRGWHRDKSCWKVPVHDDVDRGRIGGEKTRAGQ